MAEIAENFKEELTCPVCLDYFSRPVTLGCGHNFCRLCLLKKWGEVDQPCPCPECRRSFLIRDFEINHRLSRLSKMARKIRPYLLQLKKESAVCERHQEEQKLFCKEDQTLLCVSCVQTQDHSKHTVCPIEKAAEYSRDKLQKTLELLWKKVELIQNMLTEEREKMLTWNEQADAWRESTRIQYKRFCEFLKYEEKWHLHLLKMDESKNMKNLRASEARLSQYLQNLKKVIIELEQNDQKTDLQLLQGVGGPLVRSESLLRHHLETTNTQVSMIQITGIWEMMKFFRENVTLDTESACPYLIVSEDMKTVTHGGFQKHIPTGPHQFEDSIILGAQIFTSGMHYWEVYVGDSWEWSVGVSMTKLETTLHKGQLPAVWILGLGQGDLEQRLEIIGGSAGAGQNWESDLGQAGLEQMNGGRSGQQELGGQGRDQLGNSSQGVNSVLKLLAKSEPKSTSFKEFIPSGVNQKDGAKEERVGKGEKLKVDRGSWEVNKFKQRNPEHP
ncbi:probable E3 ubiquitin-protein ligase TRIML1 [Monodelphis domestica]|uniref:probable E3 ubiquitin-protein ligase TRIML1 n=1 Tax=Monodelphis domestica TaxID=13616 RepID=UPI0024E1F9DC|nr:probable E3 ubiquitin-protein ligase TRIML1 [Monodelphis domestica]